MAYMAGNLARRFRSKRARSQECTSSQACVIEVVTSNFRETVLDETKVGGIALTNAPCAEHTFKLSMHLHLFSQ